MTYKIINRSDTRCSACHGNADPSERAHIHGGPGSGWSSGSALWDENGCGAVFDEPPVSYYANTDVSRFDE